MKKMIEKIKNNKVLKFLFNFIYFLLFILVAIILVVVILQRVSNNTLSLGGFRLFNIISGSMAPKYQVGDVLLSKSIDPSNLQVGDDIVYIGQKDDFAGKIITHQIINIEQKDGKYFFHTKGLANNEEDPLVAQEQIKGKIIYKVHTLSFISKIINNLYSFYFVIFIPLGILAFIEILKVVISIRNRKNGDELDEEDGDEKKQ